MTILADVHVHVYSTVLYIYMYMYITKLLFLGWDLSWFSLVLHSGLNHYKLHEDVQTRSYLVLYCNGVQFLVQGLK